MLVAGCAAAAGDPPAGRVYAEPVAIFVSPDPPSLERMRARMGSGFEVSADDAMWYRAEAMTLLDSLAVRYEMADHGPMRFRVRGEEREYRWEGMEEKWFVVLYDGSSEPRATFPVDIRESLSLHERGTR